LPYWLLKRTRNLKKTVLAFLLNETFKQLKINVSYSNPSLANVIIELISNNNQKLFTGI